jgi:hypothetical protein
MDIRLLDNCPIGLQSNAINSSNHLKAIEEANLGPADPLEKNSSYWTDKAVLWGISEGDARGRLCNNCEHYFDNPEIRACIENGPAYTLKASQLPLTPPWADIEDHPVGYCNKFDITCSPIRTCDEQEILERPYEADTEDEIVNESSEASNPVLDYVDPFKSPLED